MNEQDLPPNVTINLLGMPVDAQRFPLSHAFFSCKGDTPQCYSSPFAAFLRSGEAKQLLLALFSWSAVDPIGCTVQGEHTPSIVLWRDSRKIVTLSSIRPNRLSESGVGAGDSSDFIVSPRHFSLLGQLGSEPLAYTRFRFHAPNGLAVFDPGCKVVEHRTEYLHPGESMLMANPTEVIDFSPEGMSQLTLQVILTKLELPLVWVFNRSNLAAVRAISASDAATRAELLLDLFSHMKFKGGRAMLNDMLRSPYHFVRWRAVQTMLKIYGVEGLDTVREACEDEHPHVRRAAHSTLKAIVDSQAA